MVDRPLCTASGCENTRFGRQRWCKVHYSRLRRTGRLDKCQPGPRARPEAERFWAKVEKTPECWLWTGSVDAEGYGRFGHFLAHRVAVRIAREEVPSELDHTCRNRRCVNPHHLQPVTSALNSQNIGGAHRDSRTGVRGVTWEKQRKKYRVRATVKGTTYSGGFFSDLASAEEAAIALRNRVMTNNLADRGERVA